MRWQLSQYDGDWASYTSDLAKQVPTFDEFRRHLIDALTSRDQTVITIRSGKSGHAVVAYDVHEQADGTLEILTYNPNTPYTSAEETDNLARFNATFASTITVTPDGRWSGASSPTATSPSRGPAVMSTIEVIDRMPPGDADLPFGFFTHTLDADDGVAEVTGIEAGGKQALRPDGTAIPGTGVTDLVRPSGEHSPIDYRLDPGRSYAFTVTGTGDGTFGDGLLGGRAGATVQGLRTNGGAGGPRRRSHLVSPGSSSTRAAPRHRPRSSCWTARARPRPRPPT